jgi:hypothetical protein
MSGSAHGGDDTLSATNSSPFSFSSFYDDADDMSGSAQGGDTLTANDDDVNSSSDLFSDAFQMVYNAQGGNDVLNGGAGNDRLWGDARGLHPIPCAGGSYPEQRTASVRHRRWHERARQSCAQLSAPVERRAKPRELLVIRRNHKTGEVSLDPLRWGLIPY